MFRKNNAALTSYEARYLGGHSAFPKSKAVHLILTLEHIEIPEMPLIIPFKRISTVQLVKEDKSATRLVTLPWAKDRKFLMLIYEDEADFEESMVFDVEKTEEAKNAILNAKKLAIT